MLFFWGITPKISTSIYGMKLKLTPGIALEKRCWLMTSLSKSSNLCVGQVNQKPFLLTSAEIEILLCQSTSFSGLTCKDSRLFLDPKTWNGSHFYPEILVCKFWQDWKMNHLPVLRILMRDLILILKYSHQNFVLWERASSLSLKWFLAYKKK